MTYEGKGSHEQKEYRKAAKRTSRETDEKLELDAEDFELWACEGRQGAMEVLKHRRAQSYFWGFGRKRKSLDSVQAGGPRSLCKSTTLVRREDGIQAGVSCLGKEDTAVSQWALA